MTDAKITGPISASKIVAGAFQSKPANVIVVAKSGGDFTTIQAAMNSISVPWGTSTVISVMPGVYTEDNIVLKDFVHIQGSGREVTTIQATSPSNDIITVNGRVNVAVSGLAIKGGNNGLNIVSCSPTINDNLVTGNNQGLNINYNATPVITGNIISQNTMYGIYNRASTSEIRSNIISGSQQGIVIDSSSPLISGNTITGNTLSGVYNVVSTAKIFHNVITNNGSLYGDIFADSASVPNISFNTFDTIVGTTTVGQYNVKSDGSIR